MALRAVVLSNESQKERHDHAVALKEYRKAVESGAYGPISPWPPLSPRMRVTGSNLRRVPRIRMLGFLLGR
jgi:hypothetical protein